MKKHLYEIWSVFVIIVIGVLSIVAKSQPIQIIASICGVIYVLGVAKENRYCQLFGIVNTAIYGYLMIHSKLYGSAIYNIAYCIPMLIYTYITWGRKENKKQISRYSLEQRLYRIILWLALMVVYYVIAVKIGINYPLVDAITIVTGAFGMYTTAHKKIEQWYCWILVNTANAFMWYIKCTDNLANIPMLAMWIIYILNNCYGLYIWNKKMKIKEK